MGNECTQFLTKRLADPSPSLVSYKRHGSLPKQSSPDTHSKDCILKPVENKKRRPSALLSQYRKPTMIDNYMIIWLVSNLDENENNIKYLKNMFNCFQVFTDIDEFFAFILDMKREEKVFLILSDIFAEKILSFIHKMCQVLVIYIISNMRSNNDEWIKQYDKIEGIFTNIESICKNVEDKVHLSENDILPNEILNSSQVIIQYLIERILLYEMKYDENCKSDILNYARQQYPDELDIIDDFEQNYLPSKAIWWYTRKCFIYHIINKAFQMQNLEMLIKVGFFIRDLHQQINESYVRNDKSDIKVVYRGQGISENDLKLIINNQQNLFTFTNFLWTTNDKNNSLRIAQSTKNSPNLFGVLFRIEMCSTTRFISLEKFSYYLNAKNEFLFSIYSLFRITNIKEIEKNIWQIDLKLINNEDSDDQQLKDYLKNLKNIEGETAWQQLGFYFIEINQYDKAEELYETLMKSNCLRHSKQLSLVSEQLGLINYKKNHSTNSLSYYKISLKHYLTYIPEDDSNLLPIYLNIGILEKKQKNYYESIKYFKCALNIVISCSPTDHLQIARIYHHIAEIYEEQKLFGDAIQYYQLALENELNHFPFYHLSIANTYTKIGEIFSQTEDYTRSLSYFDKVLKIEKKILSPNHSLLAITNYNIAKALAGLCEYKKSIEYASQAVNIARHTFGSNHENVQLYENYVKKLRRRTLINVVPNGAVYE
ncbi:unnamed protein product [Adineta steineri]|uniref:Uncharacterized protein n=4 Tax=Adineta steineri TaxID=433720 RepID=A0A815QZ52_9BILA|nr:unnamed protein product [Adineta steineri]